MVKLLTKFTPGEEKLMVVAFVAFLVGVGLAALTKNAVVGLAAAAIVMIVGFLATRGRRR